MNIFAKEQAKLREVAARHQNRGGRLAQVAEELYGLADALGPFDGAESTMDAMGGPEQSTRPFEGHTQNPGLNPYINSFVKPKEVEPVPEDVKIHTCTVSFAAPSEIDEAKIMSYIMNIESELGVKVDRFGWQVKNKDQR